MWHIVMITTNVQMNMVINMIRNNSDIADAQVNIIALVVDREYEGAIEALMGLQDDIHRKRMWG